MSFLRTSNGFTLFALGFACVLAFLDRQLLNILVGPIRLEAGIDDVRFSLLQGVAFAAVYCLAALPVAWLSDRSSRKAVIIASVATWSAMTLLFGLAASFPVLLIARMGVALGEAGLSPASISILRQAYPAERQSFAVALLTLSVYIGGGVSMIVGGPALELLQAHEAQSGPLFGLSAWRVLFVGCAALGVPALVLLALMREPARADRRPEAAGISAFVQEVRSRGIPAGAYLAAGIGMNALVYAVMAWTPAMLMRDYQWTAQQTGTIYGTIYIVGGIVGALAGGRIAGRLDRGGTSRAVVTVLRAACVVMSVATALAAFMPTPLLALAWIALGMMAMGTLISLNAYGFQALFAADYSARAVALNFFVSGTLGASLGPSAVPVLAAWIGASGSTGAALALFAIACGIWSLGWLTVFLSAGKARPPARTTAPAAAS